MSLAECLDVGDKVIHPLRMRRINPSCQGGGDGFVRKLRRTIPSPISADMAGAGIDIDLVKKVLSEATADGGPFTMRGLSKKADLHRDAVFDIINDRNKNPTIKTLSALAEAMDTDLAVFGLSARTVETNVVELERAIGEALEHMPRRDRQKQARYLAAVVADVIELPPDRPANDYDPRS